MSIEYQNMVQIVPILRSTKPERRPQNPAILARWFDSFNVVGDASGGYLQIDHWLSTAPGQFGHALWDIQYLSINMQGVASPSCWYNVQAGERTKNGAVIAYQQSVSMVTNGLGANEYFNNLCLPNVDRGMKFRLGADRDAFDMVSIIGQPNGALIYLTGRCGGFIYDEELL